MIEIKHRFSGEVLFKADVATLKLAVEAAVSSRTNLGGADLRGADLGGADLGGAYLGRADLGGAYLGGDNIIDAGEDRRGYRFFGAKEKETDLLRINAGCRENLTLEQANWHWSKAHANDPELAAECLAKVVLIETVARARGWKIEAEDAEKPVDSALDDAEDDGIPI